MLVEGWVAQFEEVKVCERKKRETKYD